MYVKIKMHPKCMLNQSKVMVSETLTNSLNLIGWIQVLNLTIPYPRISGECSNRVNCCQSSTRRVNGKSGLQRYEHIIVECVVNNALGIIRCQWRPSKATIVTLGNGLFFLVWSSESNFKYFKVNWLYRRRHFICVWS